jgi:hypothetical protein
MVYRSILRKLFYVLEARRRAWLVVLCALALAGCGGTPAATAPGGDVTRQPGVAPQGMPNQLVNCNRAELETWISRAKTATQEFADKMNSSVATLPAQMGEVISQLQLIATSLRLVAVPDCARSHYDELLAAMGDALNRLSNYAASGQGEIGQIILTSNSQLDQARQREQALIEIYNAMPAQ